jgi:hypothetical protein
MDGAKHFKKRETHATWVGRGRPWNSNIHQEVAERAGDRAWRLWRRFHTRLMARKLQQLNHEVFAAHPELKDIVTPLQETRWIDVSVRVEPGVPALTRSLYLDIEQRLTLDGLDGGGETGAGRGRVDTSLRGTNIVAREPMIMRWRHQGVHSVATVAVSGTDSPTYKYNP